MYTKFGLYQGEFIVNIIIIIIIFIVTADRMQLCTSSYNK